MGLVSVLWVTCECCVCCYMCGQISPLFLFCLLYHTQLGNMLIDALAKYYFGLPFDAEGQIVSAELISTHWEVH